MAKLLSSPSKNGVQKQLAAELLSTASTGDPITFSDVDGIPNLPGVLVIDRVDANGTATPSKREYIEYSGTSGSTVLITTRNVDGSSSAQTHAVGAIVEFVPDVVWADRIYDALSNIININDVSALASGVTFSSPNLSNAKILNANATTGDLFYRGSTGVVERIPAPTQGQILSANATVPVFIDNYNSMARQAIINGNFDVWQRGTSVALTDATVIYQADHWLDYNSKDGGTLPTLTRSRQLQTSGDIAGSFYFTRLATNGAGTSLGVNSQGGLFQRIENGVRNLCGVGKKVTVSFWARSSIVNKRICPTLQQNYGTGGSPSSAEFILGTPITLTSTWTKYIATFTTNTLVGKTFGTAVDDYLQLNLFYMWGTTLGNAQVQASVTAETYVGSGNIDIAQVQLCAGDVALPFMPKSFDEELRACERYAFVPDGTVNQRFIGIGMASSTTVATILINLPVPMRVAPTLTATAADWQLFDPSTAAYDLTVIGQTAGETGTNTAVLLCTVASGLTAARTYFFRPDASAPRIMILSSEL